MSVGSRGVFLLMAVEGVSQDFLVLVFLVYCLWCGLGILVVCNESFIGVGDGTSYFILLGTLFGFPVSLGVFYKVLVCFGVFPCGLSFLFSWSIFVVCEQFYLVKLMLRKGQALRH